MRTGTRGYLLALHRERPVHFGEVAELAEGAPLLREYGSKRLIVGSNPTLSAQDSVAGSLRDPATFLGTYRRGGRAVECTGLENQRALAGTVGSNPTPSARKAPVFISV